MTKRLAIFLSTLILAGCASKPVAAVQITIGIANPTPWTDSGWTLGDPIGATDPIPNDCTLRAREGVPSQYIALCPANYTLVVSTEAIKASQHLALFYLDSDRKLVKLEEIK